MSVSVTWCRATHIASFGDVMVHARITFAILALLSTNLRADEPGSAPATGATSLNQSLAIDEPAPQQGPGDEADAPKGNAAQLHHSAPIPALPERAPIVLGKRRGASESNSIEGEAGASWYRSSLGAMVVVLGLIAALYLVMRRWSPSLKTSGSGIVQVLGRTVLGPRQSLVLVQLGQRLVLVGVSADRMERICEVADAGEVSTLLAEGRHVRGHFSTWLDRESAEFARSGVQDSTDGEARGESSKNLTQLLRKLRTIKV